jgi:hypothetical protein
MAALTFVLVIIGFRIGRQQIELMSRQTTLMTRQTEIQDGALKQATMAANTAHDALTRIERPWIVVTPRFPSEIEAGRPLFISYTIANGGRSPAFIKRRDVRVDDMTPDQMKGGPMPFDGTLPQLESVVAPQSRVRSNASLLSPLASLAWARIVRGEEKVVMIGAVVYQDVFMKDDDAPHEHAFCYEFVILETLPWSADERDPDRVQALRGYWISSGPPGWTKNT